MKDDETDLSDFPEITEEQLSQAQLRFSGKPITNHCKEGTEMNNWLYNEFKHCGVDYAKAENAEKYEDRHLKFRDFEKEFKEMVNFLDLQKTEDKIVIDLGCGTGAFTIFAAKVFKTVYAVDVSKEMIEQARKKIDTPVPNLNFVNAGFLTYKHEGEPVDLIITKVAFHHLPDFWKQVALLRMNKMLKMNGVLYIHDVVFQFDPQEYARIINLWVSEFEKIAGEKFRSEIEAHIRDEYSTFDWIMKAMLEKAGFVIEKQKSANDLMIEYACRKVIELTFEDA